MSADPSGRAKKYSALNVIGITNSRVWYLTYGQYGAVGVKVNKIAKWASSQHHFLFGSRSLLSH